MSAGKPKPQAKPKTEMLPPTPGVQSTCGTCGRGTDTLPCRHCAGDWHVGLALRDDES
ncbi:MAG: hypothetical protein HOY78_02580 [Saccharothrix sp.]|nr:hypothetical protein [Saccharothrix sp.]